MSLNDKLNLKRSNNSITGKKVFEINNGKSIDVYIENKFGEFKGKMDVTVITHDKYPKKTLKTSVIGNQ